MRGNAGHFAEHFVETAGTQAGFPSQVLHGDLPVQVIDDIPANGVRADAVPAGTGGLPVYNLVGIGLRVTGRKGPVRGFVIRGAVDFSGGNLARAWQPVITLVGVGL